LGVILNVEVFTTLMRLLTRDMSCLLTERLQGNYGYGIDVWDILHLGTLRFYFLAYLLVTLSPSNVKLVYRGRIIELLFLPTTIKLILLFHYYILMCGVHLLIPIIINFSIFCYLWTISLAWRRYIF